MRIRLSDDDRTRLGNEAGRECPEWLEYDFAKLSLREAILLQHNGVDAAKFRDELSAEPTNFQAWLMLIYLAVARAGLKVSLDDFDVNGDGIDLDFDDQAAAASPGKDPSTPTTTSNG